MELVPDGTFDDGIRFPHLREHLSSEAQIAHQAKDRQNHAVKPRKFKRESFLDSIQDTFEEIGGTPRLIQWADKNYDAFVTKVVAKTLTPAINQLAVHASGPVQIVCPIGMSALDTPDELTPDGKIVSDVPPAPPPVE